jgi:hypothetical protein
VLLVVIQNKQQSQFQSLRRKVQKKGGRPEWMAGTGCSQGESRVLSDPPSEDGGASGAE